MAVMKKQAPQRTQAAQAGSGVRGNKAPTLLEQALRAAGKRCDEFGDGPEAREQMHADVVATPPELLPDLLVALTTARFDRALFFSNQPEKGNP